MVNNAKLSSMELLKMYYDEWKFRQENLWKRIVQFVIIIFFTSAMPVIVKAMYPNQLSIMPMLVFPIAGIALAVFSLWFFLAEAVRIKAIDQKIKLIIGDNFPEKYCKTALPPLFECKEKQTKTPSPLQWRMTT